MGAEFCMVSLIWDKNRTLDWAAGHKVLDSLTVAKENCDMIEDGDGLWMNAQAFHGRLDDIRKAAEDEGGPCFVIEIGHLKILVTGGETYGDDPTELYTDILLMDDTDADILRAVGINLEHPDYKALLGKILAVKNIRPLLIGLDEELDKMIAPKLKGR